MATQVSNKTSGPTFYESFLILLKILHYRYGQRVEFYDKYEYEK